ncbi:ABC transporter ATP-binding protein [Clostridium frigidicarnis]|uniref:ABC-type multidrug transport system, ATPase and permease component n=1 Tax=Clostridium frigidicarnis TaxID=84698 RepID=A0A1I1A280_9CLOT|nr:ABC transporter ATP-binding protein [Clostridium frigidicarnis]SFB30698.1 ABC-type multidrug transport system, ATPase and permease component [Clostridium frigidicarnis]
MKKYLFKYKLLFILRCFTILVCSILDISLAFLLGYLIQLITNRNFDKLFHNGLIIIIIFLLSYLIISYLNRYIRAIYMKKTLITLKNDLFNSIIKKDMKEFTLNNSGKYISILTNDMKIIEDDFFNNIFNLISFSLSFFIALISLISISVYITLTIVILGFFTFIIPTILSNKLIYKKTRYSHCLENFTSTTKDMLSGFEVIKSFNLYNKVEEVFGKSTYKMEESKKDYTLMEEFINLLAALLGFSMFIGVIMVGGFLNLRGIISFGSIIASVQLMNNIATPLSSSVAILNRIKSIKNISNKIESILLSNNKEDIKLNKINKFNKSIELKDVTFGYDENKNVLDDINLTFEKGKKYAIVGESGCGKSTLIKLILGYYNEYYGQILVDNLNLKAIDFNDFYNHISVINQNVFMFDGTIEDNIGLYSNYSKDTIDEALEVSGLKKFIDKLELGIKDSVGENGNKLSGGEKQRIAIARALIKKSSILILDESTSSLDNETSYNIENSILNLDYITAIVVTHKLREDILRKYDEIIVMKNGRIIEIGKFSSLIERHEYFYNLYYLYGGLETTLTQ